MSEAGGAPGEIARGGGTPPVAAHRRAAPTVLGYAILTVSDTRTLDTDVGGATAARLAEAAGQRVVARSVVRDETAAIREAVAAALADAAVDVVVATGGTGFSPRDITVEAVEPLLARRVEGFGEIFRALSYAEVGAAAMLSRAIAGIAAGGAVAKAVYAIPGSPAAVELAMSRLILPESGHLLAQARRPG